VRALARRVLVAFQRRKALSASWRRLTWSERREFLAFVLLIPAITVALRTLGFRRTHAWVGRQGGPGATARSVLARDAAVRGLQRARCYAPYRGNCLPQSLALWWRLKRQGFEAEFCLGARVDEGALAAHAWVEAGGRTLNDSTSVRQRFSAFDSFDSSRDRTSFATDSNRP
jgi:hypothetical protein